MPRLRRVILDLLPEASDMDVDGRRIAVPGEVPDALEQLGACERPPGVGCQELEEVVLLPRQDDVATIAPDDAAIPVNLESPDRGERTRAGRLRGRSAEHSPDPRDDLP